MLNRPDTLPSEDPVLRISKGLTLCPRIKDKAEIIIDFPAPVSPVRTLSPLENSIARVSIIPIFSI